MTKLDKCIFTKLDLYKNPTKNVFKIFKRNVKWGIILYIVLIINIPIALISWTLWGICYFPSKLFEKLNGYLMLWETKIIRRILKRVW